MGRGEERIYEKQEVILQLNVYLAYCILKE